jgi:hypothetical protein
MTSKIMGLLAVGLLALPSMGHAALVTISGQGSADGDWNVTTVSDASVPAGYGAQVWWGNQSLAQAFAETLGGVLGYPNQQTGGNSAFPVGLPVAPLFGYEITGGGCCGLVWSARTVENNGTSVLRQGVNGREALQWAVAERVTTSPPPVPLPAAAWLLLSGLAGLGVLGRRRKA